MIQLGKVTLLFENEDKTVLDIMSRFCVRKQVVGKVVAFHFNQKLGVFLRRVERLISGLLPFEWTTFSGVYHRWVILASAFCSRCPLSIPRSVSFLWVRKTRKTCKFEVGKLAKCNFGAEFMGSTGYIVLRVPSGHHPLLGPLLLLPPWWWCGGAWIAVIYVLGKCGRSPGGGMCTAEAC